VRKYGWDRELQFERLLELSGPCDDNLDSAEVKSALRQMGEDLHEMRTLLGHNYSAESSVTQLTQAYGWPTSGEGR